MFSREQGKNGKHYRSTSRLNASDIEFVRTPDVPETDVTTVVQMEAGHDFSKMRVFADESTVEEKPIGLEGGQVGENLTARIRAEQGNGSTLDTSIRQQMEERLGFNFANVHLHADATSRELSQNVGARAFTTGNDIFLGSGTSPDETSMLAHELTHVVQQKGMSNTGPLIVGPAGDSFEQEASVRGQYATSSQSSTAMQVNQAPITEVATPGALIQRQGTHDSQQDQRISDLERQQRVLAKHQAATDLDLRWRARFGERMASYRQTILRISGGLDAATQGFQSAQVAQAQTDALETQLIGAAVAIVFAAGFEWAASGALGALGVSASRIESTVELIENPMNAAVSGGVNVAGVNTATNSATQGQTPNTPSISGVQTPAGAAGGGAMAFLTSNSEALEHHVQLIEQAFINRSTRMQALTDDQWEAFDPAAQEKVYQQLLDDLAKDVSGVEQLKAPAQVAQVFERHLWALWISNQADELGKEYVRNYELHHPELSSPPSPEAPPRPGVGQQLYEGQANAEQGYDLGSDIEVRLNQVGVSGLAGVTLTGHWYSGNSPDNWRRLLLNWSRTYNESIHV